MYFFPPNKVKDVASLIVNIICVGAFTVLVKKEGLGFREHGLYWPKSYEKHVFTAMILAFVHFSVTVFLPGAFIGFEALPATPFSNVPLEITATLLTAFAGESIFRGYIQRNLTEAYGFYPALFISSFLFSLHAFPLPLIGSFHLISELSTAMSLFLMGAFLGFFFQRTMNLVGPVTFYMVALLLRGLTPLAAMKTEYELLFEATACVLLIILLRILVVEEGHSNPSFVGGQRNNSPIATDNPINVAPMIIMEIPTLNCLLRDRLISLPIFSSI